MPVKPHASKSKNKTFVSDSYKIIDANFNRAKEGLRVCEEILRFHLKNAILTKKFRALRHSLTNRIKASRLNQRSLFYERDVSEDFGKTFGPQETQENFKQIFLSNAQRVKEALRVLEEFLKLFDASTSKKIQFLRFNFYVLEKECVKKFPSLLNSR